MDWGGDRGDTEFSVVGGYFGAMSNGPHRQNDRMVEGSEGQEMERWMDGLIDRLIDGLIVSRWFDVD